jgi:hypothetical protein
MNWLSFPIQCAGLILVAFLIALCCSGCADSQHSASPIDRAPPVVVSKGPVTVPGLSCGQQNVFFATGHVHQPAQSMYVLQSPFSSSESLFLENAGKQTLGRLGYQLTDSQHVIWPDEPVICPGFGKHGQLPRNNSYVTTSAAPQFILEALGPIVSRNIEDSHRDMNYWQAESASLQVTDCTSRTEIWLIVLDNCRSTSQVSRSAFAGLLSAELHARARELFERFDRFIDSP